MVRTIVQNLRIEDYESASIDRIYAFLQSGDYEYVSGVLAYERAHLNRPAVTALADSRLATLAPDAAEPITRGDLQAAVSGGPLASRPAASTLPTWATYFATDDNGGTLYTVVAGAWTKAAAGRLEVASVVPLARRVKESNFPTTNDSTSPADVTGMTGITFTYPASGAVDLDVDITLTNDTAANRAVFQIIDDLGAVLITGAYRVQTANDQFPVRRRRTLEAAAGTVRTLKLQIWRSGGTTATLLAAPTIPATITINPSSLP